MSLSKFRFIIPEKKTAKGRSVSQKEYEAKRIISLLSRHLNFRSCFMMKQLMKCLAKPVARGMPAKAIRPTWPVLR